MLNWKERLLHWRFGRHHILIQSTFKLWVHSRSSWKQKGLVHLSSSHLKVSTLAIQGAIIFEYWVQESSKFTKILWENRLGKSSLNHVKSQNGYQAKIADWRFGMRRQWHQKSCLNLKRSDSHHCTEQRWLLAIIQSSWMTEFFSWIFTRNIGLKVTWHWGCHVNVL